MVAGRVAGRIQNTEYRIRAALTPPSLRQPSFQNPESNIHSCAISAPMHMHHMHMSPAEYRMQNTEPLRPCPPRHPSFQNPESRIGAAHTPRARPSDSPVSRIQNPESGRPTPAHTARRFQHPESRGPHTHPTQPPTDSRIQNPGAPEPSAEPSARAPNRPQIPASRIQHPEFRGGASRELSGAESLWKLSQGLLPWLGVGK